MSTETIGAVLLPVGIKTEPEPVLLSHDNCGDELQDIVGGWFDAVRVVTTNESGDRCVLVGYVNDSGAISNMEFNYFASALFQRELFGPCVVVSGTSPNGSYDGDSYDVPDWAYDGIVNSLVTHARHAYDEAKLLKLAFDNCVEEGLCTKAQRDSLRKAIEESVDGDVELSDDQRMLLEDMFDWASEYVAQIEERVSELAKNPEFIEDLMNAIFEKEYDDEQD